MQAEEQKKEITVEEMDELVVQIMMQRQAIEEHEEEGKALNKVLTELQAKSVQYLKALGRDNFKSAHGTISLVQKWRVNLPKTEDDKKAFFRYLTDKGIFWDYATVNSNSLISLYLADWEAAKERGEGMEFKVPGIGEPTLYETLSVRKK